MKSEPCPKYPWKQPVAIMMIFEPRVREKMNLEGVMSTDVANKWQTFTPTTLRIVPGEMALLTSLRENGKNFEKVEDAWHASVLPRRAFVIYREDEYFAVAFLHSRMYSVSSAGVASAAVLFEVFGAGTL